VEIFEGITYGCKQLEPSKEASGVVHWVRINLTARGIALYVTSQDPTAVSQGWQYRLRRVGDVVAREHLAVAINGTLFYAKSNRLLPMSGDLANAKEPVVADHTISHVWDDTYRISYRVGNNGKEIRTAALPLTVITGPTLQHVYEYPRPYYLINSPGYTVRADMLNGLHRFLADDDDTVRLNGSPLFTFSDGSTELLSEKTTHAFTWPQESPANILAHAEDRVRWQALYFNDRILIRMDPGWTQFQKTYFSVPDNWSSPQGPPRWKRIVALDRSGKEVDAQPGAKVKVAAAELEFPGAKWSLAFKFEPAQEVAFNGTELKFAIGSLTNDNWQVGFCRPGELEAWRNQ
jgi:hypothetical protein